MGGAKAQMRQIYLDNNEDNEILKISFYSASEGYMAFKDWIGFTSDSGRTYSRKYITTSNVDYNGYSVNLTFGFGITGVKAFSRDTIIVYGHYAAEPSILYSVNQGNSFKLVYQSEMNSQQLTQGIMDMAFTSNPNIGYAVEADRIIKTTDKGLTWSEAAFAVNSFFDQVLLPDANTVYALSTDYYASKMMKSVNSGLSWQAVSKPSSGSIGSAFFLTASKGWLNMIDGQSGRSRIFFTANGGQSWIQRNDVSANPLKLAKLMFIDDSTGFATENLYTIYKTTDGGKIWEPMPRDNQFAYLGYGHNDLFRWGSTQLWAGGGHGFLELNTDPGQSPLPKAYFLIDTSGMYQNGKVKLVNHSKPSYTVQWYVNNVLVGSDFQASYTHDINSTLDSVVLIVSNGVRSDTLKKFQQFHAPLYITSFSPTTGATGTAVTIRGYDFSYIREVFFGGARATSFSIVSPTEIRAVVGNGRSGSITVVSTLGNSASLPGFTYIPPPVINLPVSVSDSILCKAESLAVTIQNTETGVKYELIDSLETVYGSVEGNGSTVVMNTSLLSVTGTYRIRASRLNIVSSINFTDNIFILVEHTRSVVVPSRVNVLPGEQLDFYNRSLEASSFVWTFDQDASQSSSLAPHTKQVHYAGPGQKTLTLISISGHGCRDTLRTDAVMVYPSPATDLNCFAENVDDKDFDYFFESPATDAQLTMTPDNGFIIMGKGNDPILKSQIGRSKDLYGKGATYMARYTRNGVLSWYMHIRSGGMFSGATTDTDGNIYVVGHCEMKGMLTLVNGDSLSIAATDEPFFDYSRKVNGFLVKLDPSGNYLWHTVFSDPTPEWEGGIQGGLPTRVHVTGDRIVVAGDFQMSLAYWKNGEQQQLAALQDPNRYFPLNYFMVNLDKDGGFLWKVIMDNLAPNRLSAVSGLGTDQSGNTYASVNYEHSITVQDAHGAEYAFQGAVAEKRSFIIKINPAGDLVWRVSMNSTVNFANLEIRAMATDAQGNSYITGTAGLKDSSQVFTATQGDGSLRDFNLAGFYMVKVDARGFFAWGVGSTVNRQSQGLTMHLNGDDVFAVATSFSPDSPGASFTSTDGSVSRKLISGSEFAILHYNTSGVLKRIAASGVNAGGYVLPNELVRDGNGNFLVSGFIENNNGGTGNYTVFSDAVQTNGHDIFYARVNAGFCLNDVPPIADAGPDRTQCAGQSTRLGTPGTARSYSWTSIPAGFSSDVAEPWVSPDTTTIYMLTVVNDAGMTARDSVVVKVNSRAIAKAGPDQTVCSGKQVAIGAPALTGIRYQWTSNPAGFTSAQADPIVAPAVTTSYYLSVLDTNGCSGTDTVQVFVTAPKVPAVTITASSDSICQGQLVTFTATPVHGGIKPAFQWRHNGVTVGTDASQYVTRTLGNGDNVSVLLTSDLACASPSVATSNLITITVDGVIPAIRITGNSKVTKGQSAILSLEISGGGIKPSFQWQDSISGRGWSDISGATSTSLMYTPGKTGDRVRCILTSDRTCRMVVTSAPIIFDVTEAVTQSSVGVILFPNPASSQITIDSLKVSDGWETLEILQSDGLPVSRMNISNKTRTVIPVDGLVPGTYIVVLRKKNGAPLLLRFIKI